MLSDRDCAVLDIEGQHWRYAGTKEAEIGRMGLTGIRYYQILNALTADPQAWDYAPMALARVTHLRDRQRHGRLR